jgi:hypothetical protein
VSAPAPPWPPGRPQAPAWAALLRCQRRPAPEWPTSAPKGCPFLASQQTLTDEGIPTARGGKWHPSTVAAVLRSIELDAEATSKASV